MAKNETARIALVTGGNRGIGLEVCKELAALGHTVYLGSRDLAAGEAVAKKAGAKAVQLDVSSDKSVSACAKKVGAVDILVNNAGVYPQGSVLAASAEDFREAFEANFWGAWRTIRAFVPGMVDRRWGRVVNVTSGYGLFSEGVGGSGGPAPYCISKVALDGLTFKLAQELGGKIKVNAVCPGWVRTRMGGSAAPRPVEKGAETIVWAATLPDDGPTGGIYRDKRALAW